MKQRMEGYWEQEVERQRAKRLEIQNNANNAADSTAARVTPPAEQEPRHGQP